MTDRVYILEMQDFQTLRAVSTRLFGDGTALTPDQRRDLANTMHVTLNNAMRVALNNTMQFALNNAQPMEEPDGSTPR
jgi:hypothetical protein